METKNKKNKISALSFNKKGLYQEFTSWGYEPYRVPQFLAWVYGKRVEDFMVMSNLKYDHRLKLCDEWALRTLSLRERQGSEDSTQKFLFELNDGELIESVLIPASPGFYGYPSDRRTLCLSSQVGCAYGCHFCASGLEGFRRNLRIDEILEQIIQVEKIIGQRINNLVFMGMGEPLANFFNVIRALEVINAPWGLQIGARHTTISTSGLVPQIRKLADISWQVRLAVSLHAANDAVRDQLMPINQKYPLDELFDALHYFRERKKQKITLEYILIEGVNDSLEDAAQLAERAAEISAKVNLIPYNNVEGFDWKRPEKNVMFDFLKELRKREIPSTLRREKGHDIAAACGQLRLRSERKKNDSLAASSLG